ncbi:MULTISPECIES: hybrid sensor histidine kinase/response regulator [Alteromonas]|uniref:hybrid sensor histidine kinase/response regulator n=1 Tax=Alteromonas TaxID=226 RepID=UPI0003555369|nr:MULTISPECIES: hybrid sensor histidine kinase/response regulator [Alteromonas]AGP84248.1 sensor protein BarA [Alteromonas mediterranea U4]AGP88361.1 sensor protein BarA [Alteromonas mediterranea U7]AGP92229.1 sensor protein BarA [Alteromonas mediterranea U8]NQY19478.1 response regulator [Alteromonas sp.]|tara:strand:+ start:1056 stop:4184 length:3129 start_codon:yes stop_codon:yes gene_type:complete
MAIFRVFFFLFFFLASGLASTAYAQHIEQLFDEESTLDLSDSLYFLFETDYQLTISDVSRRRNDFLMHPHDNPNFGFRNNGMWLLTSVANVSNEEDWVFTINFSQLDSVDFYLVKNGKVIKQSHQGKAQKEQRFRVPTFRIELSDSDAVDLYIRIESRSSSLIAPLRIQAEPIHSSYFQADSMLWGFFYGGLLILAISNLALFFGVREKSLIAYVGYIGAVLLWQFVWGGHIQLVFSQGIPSWLVGHSELIFVIIGISSGVFTMTFLETNRHSPTAHPIIKLLLICQGLTGLICFVDLLPSIWKNNLVYGVGLVAILSYIYAGFEAFFNNFKPARYFIFAWGMLATGAIVGMLSLIGVLPSNDFTTYCFQVGVFLEAGLFSFALMEKSRSQLESEVEQATNDLRNNVELIEEQNARLDIARKDAIKASNVKSQFLANMSHEIRTPLNAILGFSKELNNASLPTDQQEQVRIVNTAADNLLTIVNDVLDFSKIEAGKLTINNQPFSPNKLLEEMVTIMAKSSHSKHLEFVFDLHPLPEKLIGDVFRIKQVLNNLLSNALKFTSSGTITFSVRGRALPHGIHEVNMTIEDTGIGISRQDRKKLFNAFSQVDDALNRNYQGTGLGLVISRELVRLMNGDLTLKSALGQGSTFIVSLRMTQLSQKYALSSNEDWLGKKVVIFDPVPATRRASANMLSILGAQVISVESLDYLATLTGQYDFFMAAVPVSKMSLRDAYLSRFVQFPAQKRILWYSGPEPFAQYPSLSQHFHSQVRMPMTLTKLDSLVHCKVTPAKNAMIEKIESLPKVKVLAVDDMEMNLKLLHTWLDHSPIELITTINGQDAVNQCQTQEFDLILMDVQMPGMDGVQATREIRKSPLNMGTPIVAVTAHAFKEEQDRLLASGMDDYLPKPIEVDLLITLIKSWCHSIEPGEIVFPSIDWQLALKRANQNQDTAKEMLDSFIAQLPETIDTLSALWNAKDYNALKAEVHKLHGACCYTGLPRMQHLANETESALKLGQHAMVDEHLPALLEEAKKVIRESINHNGTF